MCPVPTHLQKHDLGERGEIGIIVANQFNKHGVCGVYIPTRRSLCHRTDYKIIPINESIRNLISSSPRDEQFLKETAFPLHQEDKTNNPNLNNKSITTTTLPTVKHSDMIHQSLNQNTK